MVIDLIQCEGIEQDSTGSADAPNHTHTHTLCSAQSAEDKRPSYVTLVLTPDLGSASCVHIWVSETGLTGAPWGTCHTNKHFPSHFNPTLLLPNAHECVNPSPSLSHACVYFGNMEVTHTDSVHPAAARQTSG